jgi:hypothetical protein
MQRKVKNDSLFNIAIHRSKTLVKGVWLFPVLLTLILIILTSLKISGTSIGIYYPLLYGNNKNPNLIVNKPQDIRSDEWLYVTQYTIAQKNAGFPRVNPNIQGGEDMSVVGDAPYKNWSSIFKPENLSFFILPFENAFAFKWWLLTYLIIISCYFFVLRLLPGKRLLASLLSTGVAFSPYLFWWYQTETLAPFFYGLFIILLSLRIINTEKIPFLAKYRYKYSLAAYVAGLAYLLTCFALVLYPPYQIPIVIAVFGFLLGVVLEKYDLKKDFQRLLKQVLLPILGSVLVTLVLVFGFILTRHSVINSVNNTVYPGHRVVKAGGERPIYILTSYYQYNNQNEKIASYNYSNQSETSDFFLFLPFLLIPSLFIIVKEYLRSNKILWSFLIIQIIALLFIGDLFFRPLQPIYDLFFLQKVPIERLRMGLGFLNFIELVLITRYLKDVRFKKKYLLSALTVLYILLCLYVLLVAGRDFHHLFKVYAKNVSSIVLWAALFWSSLALFLIKKPTLAAMILLVFSFISIMHVQPLYKGLSPMYQSKLSKTIASYPTQKSWVSLNDIIYENLPQDSGQKSLSGIQLYPNLKLWSGIKGAKQSTYNRYAHVVFSPNPNMKNLQFVQFDSFMVKLQCSKFIQSNVQYVVTQEPFSLPCYKLINKVVYPVATFNIYKQT